ncbi:MAG: GNAT family N-acetyltransferase [Rhodobacter sp.]|nr:GNAT family N-acetyltransferase [Rhodobacter sp.]
MTPHLADTPVLETDRLRLRAPDAQDWPLWNAFAQSDRAEHIGGPYTLRTAWRGFAHVVGMWVLRGYGSFVITAKDDDTALGMAGPWHPADWPEQEIGWTIWAPENEGKGIAFEAAQAARRFAYDRLGWTTAVSYIDAPNTRSIALAERLGATRDPNAEAPNNGSDTEVLVYRHPAPEAVH